MESKTILFTVDGDNISPRTEQKAGVQGQHNITEVKFDVTALTLTDKKVRIQFIDGAGGFYSTGFLDVVIEDDKKFVSTPIPDNVTNAGGVAYAYLVVTKIAYDDDLALEEQVYISPPGKLFYTHSGVGSPSEYAYRVGISNALVNAEAARKDAEIARDEAEAAKEAVETELNRYISHWQPNTKYKVGDCCIAPCSVNDFVVYAIFTCIKEHISDYTNAPNYNLQSVWDLQYITAIESYQDILGNVIHETYATKEEIVGTLGTINEVLATLVEVE